jgi:hypothetical protein
LIPNEAEPNGTGVIEPVSPPQPVRPEGSKQPGQPVKHLINLVTTVIISTYLVTHSITVSIVAACSATLLALLGHCST